MEKQKIKNFTDLDTWKKSHKLAIDVYKVTKEFPKEELFSLVSQMRRAVISIGSNIAEGFSRNSSKEKIQFYFISKGSLTELQNQLLLSRDIGYISIENCNTLLLQTDDIHKMLNGLIRGLKKVSD